MRPFLLAVVCSVALSVSSCSVFGSTTKEAEKPSNASAVPTDEEELELLSEALKLYEDGFYSGARDNFKKLIEKFPLSYYTVLAELKSGDANYQLGDYPTAISEYEEFERLRPNHEAIPYVQFQIANSHLSQYRGIVHDQFPAIEAKKAYKRLLAQHPKSLFVADASERIEFIESLLQAHDEYVDDFYQRQGIDSNKRLRPAPATAQVSCPQFELRCISASSDSPLLELLPKQSVISSEVAAGKVTLRFDTKTGPAPGDQSCGQVLECGQQLAVTAKPEIGGSSKSQGIIDLSPISSKSSKSLRLLAMKYPFRLVMYLDQ